MKVSCPHCSQRILLDTDSLASLHGFSGFDCPHCGGWIPFPPLGTPSSPPPGEHRSRGWAAPEAEELAKSFDSRYQIRRLLGRGGMGAVYEGFDTRLDRRVAIKILPQETGSDSHALARFEREAKAMAALDHPNIVHIHDYGQTPDGNPYFVMEFIDGMDVHHLRQSGQLDLPGALELVSQVCAALQYAHSRGIVHRDIKPANILVSSEGVAKVADFGLAKVLGTDTHAPHEPTLTRSGTAMGTPDYMAPEQMEGQPIDHRADIYSLGIMLYDLLTGSPPRGAWPPPSQRVQIDVRLDEIVLRSLQHNPSARYQAASEVRADIDSVKSSTGGGPLPPGTHSEPLPSQRSAAPAASLQSFASAPGGNRSSRGRPADAPVRSHETASASSLSNTMLILGLLAIAITGGLAFYLANRKPTETHTSQELVENTTIHRDIPPGMTAKDLDGVGDIRSHAGGFIGISMEAVDSVQADELAKRTGAEVLAVDPSDPAWPALHDWLRGHFQAPLTMQAWVVSQGEPRLLDKEKIAAPETANPTAAQARHKVLLHWKPEASIPTNPQIEPTTPQNPPPGPLPDPLPADEPSEPSPPAQVTVPAEPSTPQPPSPPPGPLSWTNTDGKTIKAEFVRLDGESVVIRKDGKEFKLPLAKLAPQSQKLAREVPASSTTWESSPEQTHGKVTLNLSTPKTKGSLEIVPRYGKQSALTPRALGTLPDALVKASDIVDVSVDQHRGLALRADGTVIPWGYEFSNLTPPPQEMLGAEKKVIQIIASASEGVDWFLYADGSIAAHFEARQYPFAGTMEASNAVRAVKIAAFGRHALTLSGAGKLSYYGYHLLHKIPPEAENAVIVDMAIGEQVCLAVTKEGKVIVWGGDNNGCRDLAKPLADAIERGRDPAILVATYGAACAVILESGRTIFWGNETSEWPIKEARIPGAHRFVSFCYHGYDGPALAVQDQFGRWKFFGKNVAFDENLDRTIAKAIAIGGGFEAVAVLRPPSASR